MKRRSFLGCVGAGVIGLKFGPPVAGIRAPVRPPVRFVERWSWAMGQPVHLQLYAESEAHGLEAAAAALAELRRVEARLSLFDDASDLAELNRHAGGRALEVGKDLILVLERSLRIESATGGGFNPAIEPLMRAWGFRAPRASEPTAAEIAEARSAVRAARIVIGGNRVALASRETRLDLGGIGVGYGLDRAIQVLRQAGIRSALLDVSGDCLALGAPPHEPRGWLVEIAPPPGRGRSFLAATYLRDAALATSANTMSVVHYGKMIRGHVMNPDTGWPADALLQVTVVSRTGVEADALSTAMLVTGRPASGVLRHYQAES